jgi:hypothetical protein
VYGKLSDSRTDNRDKEIDAYHKLLLEKKTGVFCDEQTA